MRYLRGGILLALLGVVGCFGSKSTPTPEVKLPDKTLLEVDSSIEVHLELDRDGQVSIEGQSLTDEEVSQWFRGKPEEDRQRMLVVIRAVDRAPTGAVQRVIKLCQNVKCERFALRAKPKE